MGTAAQAAEVIALAESYSRQPTTELYWMLEATWAEARGVAPVPVHGLSGFWADLHRSLVERIVANKDAGSATLGYVTAQVLDELQAMGLDLHAYRISIAIFVAIVWQSACKALERSARGSKDEPDDGYST